MRRQMLINYYTVDIVSKTGRNDKLKNLIMWSLWKFQISKQVKFEKENDIFNDDTISIRVNKIDGIVKSSRPMRPKEIAKFVEDIKDYSEKTYRVYYGKTYEDLLRLKDMKLIEYVQFEDGEIRIKFNKKMIELTQDKNVDINKAGYNKGTHLFKFIDYDVIEKLNPRALTVYMHIFLNHKYYMNIDKYKDRCETSWEKLERILNVNSKENDNDLRKILEKIVTTINNKLGTDIEIAKSKRGINIKFRYFTLTKLVGTVKREDNKEEEKVKDNEFKECPLTTEELFDYARNYGVILRDNDIYYMGNCSIMLATFDTIKSGTKENIIKFIEEEEIRNELYDYLESYKDDIEADEEFKYYEHRESVEWWTSLNITRQ